MEHMLVREAIFLECRFNERSEAVDLPRVCSRLLCSNYASTPRQLGPIRQEHSTAGEASSKFLARGALRFVSQEGD
jgi:hypothetical protein